MDDEIKMEPLQNKGNFQFHFFLQYVLFSYSLLADSLTKPVSSDDRGTVDSTLSASNGLAEDKKQ